MKKSRKIIIAILALILIVAVAVSGYRYGVIVKAKTGYLIYIEDTIKIIDLKNTTKSEFNIDGYSDFGLIGKYYGGDFCCKATNDETTEQEILLFNNGVIEKSYIVIEKIISIAAHNDKIYYLTEENKNKGNLNCIYKDKTELIANDVEEFTLNSLGEIAYIKDITPSEEYSAESSINGELYYFENGKHTKLGEACGVDAWLSNDELLISTEKVDVTYNEDGDLVSARHTFGDYIVNVENKEWKYSKEFNRLSAYIIDISQDRKIAIIGKSNEAFELASVGLYDIEKDIQSKSALYDKGIKNEDIYNDMGFAALWLDENPME